MFFAMTAFAAGITSDGSAKFYLDLTAVTSSVATGGNGYYPAPYYFANGETTSETFNLEHETDKYYEISVPEGTWTGFYIKFSMYSIELTLDGEHNCFVAKKTSNKMEATAGGKSPIFASMMWWDNAGGTWSTVAPAGEEEEEPAGVVIAGGTKLYLDVYYYSALKKGAITTTFSDGTNEISLNAVDTINKSKYVYSVTAPEGNWTSVTYKIGTNYTLTLTEYDGVKTYFKVFDKFNGGATGNDGDGMWLAYSGSLPTLPSGTNIANKKVLYFAPNASLAESCDAYRVVFFDSYGVMCKTSALSKLSDGKYFFTNNVGTAASFSIIAYKADKCVARFDNVTWDGAGTLFVVNEDATAGTWDATYVEPARIINTEWSIKSSEEGSEEGFSSVQVTFSGIDPNGRLLGGDATGINLVANFAKAASFFKVDDETGKETAVVTLTNKNNGFLTSTKISDFTYELSLVPDAYELVDGKYMREGHYRIKILKSYVEIEPKPLNALKASADFVFDFTIDNDYVFPTIIDDMTYIVEPAKSVVSEIGEVVVEFDADITLSELQEKPVLKFGEITYPLNCEIVDGYQLKLTIAQEGVEKLTENGFYEITIPEGLVYYDDPAEKNLNAEITIGFTIAPVMPANGVIYFDPSNEVVIESLAAKFVDGAGNTKGADVVRVGELYKIEMPKGDEWVRFDIEGWGDDPEDGVSNLVLLYSVSNLFYNGENNLFTLNEDAPADATAENGVWGKHVVTPIEGGTTFYLNVASSSYFTENATNFIWKTKFVNAEDEAGAEMDSIDLGIYKVVAPEGTWDMFLLYFYYNGSDREYMGVYLEYDGENDMFVFREDANVRALVGAWDKYVPNGEGGDPTNVENAMLSTITVQNGMIVAEGEFQIFTITGQNVTSMNGSLEKGVYVVKSANAVVKVMVK